MSGTVHGSNIPVLSFRTQDVFDFSIDESKLQEQLKTEKIAKVMISGFIKATDSLFKDKPELITKRNKLLDECIILGEKRE